MLKKRFWNNYVKSLLILFFSLGYVTLPGINAVSAQTVMFYGNTYAGTKCKNALTYMYDEDDIPVISEDSGTVSMDTYENNTYTLGSYNNSVIDNLNYSSVVTITSSNPDVVDVGYCDYSNWGIDDYYGEISIKGNDIYGREIPVIEFRAKKADNKKHKAKAEITITISDAEGKHEPIVRTFQVNVKGVKPKLSAKYTKTNFDINSIYLEISNITRSSKITISANKDKAFVVEEGGKNGKGVTVGKKAKRIWVNYSIRLIPKKTGKLTVKVTVKQDGYTVTRSYKLNIVKYVNPFKSVKLYDKQGKSQEIAKYYDKSQFAGTAYPYGYTGKCTIVLKSGYSITKVTYYDYKTGKEKTCKLRRSNGKYIFEMDGKHPIYYVICKDKNGNIYKMLVGREC